MRARDDARAMENDDRLTRRDAYTIQGVATLAAAKPSFAAYGESANVFGGISNPTGARDTIDIALEIDSVWVDAGMHAHARAKRRAGRGTRDGMSEMGKENDARRWKSARGGDARMDGRLTRRMRRARVV